MRSQPRSKAFRAGTLILVTLSAYAPQGAQARIQPEPPETYAVELYAPLPLSEVQAVTAPAGYQVQQLVRVFQNGEHELSVGFLIEGKLEGSLEDEFRRSVAATLADLASAKSAVEADPSTYDPMPALLEAAHAEFGKDGARVTELTVSGPASAAVSLSNIGRVSKKERGLVPINPPDAVPSSAPLPEAKTNVGIEAVCNRYFVPALTTATTGQSSIAGQRYVQQNFHWDTYNYNALRACGSNITYEQEFVTNNYDRLQYLASSHAGWSSTLPKKYLDTTFADSSNERSYTIGTSDATKLHAYTTYTTYIRTYYGNASGDTAKITGQRGVRRPSFCHSTWCILAQATEFISTGTWPIRVPGTSSWNH